MRTTLTTATKLPIDPELLKLARTGSTDAIIIFNDPSTGAPTQEELGKIDAMPLGAERKKAAYDALQKRAEAMQTAYEPTLAKTLGKTFTDNVDTLWNLGAIRLRGASLEQLRSIAANNSVKAVISDQHIDPPSLPGGVSDAVDGAITLPPRFNTRQTKAATDNDPNQVFMDWGVKKMQAPAAWAQGITGAGIVIGSLDTGVAVQHPVLRNNYRGTNPDGSVSNDYNWKDVVKETPEDGKLPDGSVFDPAKDKTKTGTSLRPIDLNGHGTHTSGSAVGWDAKHITGVAPDAKLIVARGLGEKGGSMFDLVNAMSWFTAPTKVDGKSPRPDLAPDIVTNSWGGQPMPNLMLWSALRAWRLSGIIPVFASGNDRNATPGRVAVPGMYPEAITVGASDLDDTRAWFSMYGPSEYAKDRKPEVMGPGHWTYSSLPDGTVRDTFPVDGNDYPASGTSMATPHIAGAVALYLQAHPNSTYDAVLGALKSSGTKANESNNEMGYGRVQVDKLITSDTIDPKAHLTSKSRVDELMTQVANAKVFKEGERKPGIPTKK